jgi:hypothetical protein
VQSVAQTSDPDYYEDDLLLPGYGGLYLEPHVRPQAIESAAPKFEGLPGEVNYEGQILFPTLHCEPLALAENNQSSGLKFDSA